MPLPSEEPSLILDVPQLQIAIPMQVQTERNPHLASAIRAALPLQSLFGHVVISGDGIWLPTRVIYLGEPRMVQRTIGSVYFNAPGQSICMTYGSITETAVVNEFAHIDADALPALRTLGEAVWRMTVTDPVRKSVRGILREAKG